MKKRPGVTFIEILFVVIIVAVLSGALMPAVKSGLREAYLESFSGDLQANMNYFRQRAIVEGATVILTIDTISRSYWFAYKDKPEKIRVWRFPAQVAVQASMRQAAFYPDGSIGEISVDICAQAGRCRQLTTKGVLGYVKLQDKE